MDEILVIWSNKGWKLLLVLFIWKFLDDILIVMVYCILSLGFGEQFM
jgi:hypothetical protein